MPGPSAADYKVELVDAGGSPDWTVSIVGDQVVSIAGASPGDVLVVGPDGQTLVTAPSSTPGAHAATHAEGGSDPVTLTIAQTTGLQTALDSKVAAALYDANTILIATSDNTPVALTVGASTFVGRKAAGDISAMSVAEAKTLLAITEADVANLTADLALKAPLASPALTGNPTAPTAAPGDNTTLIATTAFVTVAGAALIVDSIADADTTHAPSRNAVFDALALKAPLAGPTFTGTVQTAALTTTGAVAHQGSTIGFFNTTPAAQISGSTDILAGFVTLGLRAASSNPPLNMGTGTLTVGTITSSRTVTANSGGNDGKSFIDANTASHIGNAAASNPVHTFTGRAAMTLSNDTVRITGIASQTGALIRVTPSGAGDMLAITGDSKMGLYGATPIVRPTTGIAAATFVSNTSLIANDSATFDGYTIGQAIKALRNVGILT